MGRGRTGIVNQSEKKTFKPPAGKDNLVWFHTPTTKKLSTVPLSEEVLNELMKLNPRAVANILVNS